MNPKLKLAAAALAGVLVTVAAGGIATATMDKGLGHFRGVDADGNGEISRTEWLQTAGAKFDALDNNKDGKLIVGEIPQAPRGGKHGHRGPRGDRDGGPEWGPDAPPPADNATVPAP